VEPLAKELLDSINGGQRPGRPHRNGLVDFIEHVYFPNVQKRPSTIHGYRHIFDSI